MRYSGGGQVSPNNAVTAQEVISSKSMETAVCTVVELSLGRHALGAGTADIVAGVL